MSSFAALMALSASQTSQAQSTAASLLAEKKKKEDEARRKKEEAERKQRELDAKIRKKRMEEEERERERQERLAKERDAKERERERREKAQLDHLLGQKKRKTLDFPTSERASGGGGGSGGGGSGASRKARADDELDSGAMALTRAEKRERKAMLEMRREFGIPKRAGSSASYGKAGRRLPGGAIDATSDAGGSSGSGSAQLSARARLTAMPNTLTKLNVNKRDTRTIDEILQDRAKLRGEVKVLDGEDARDFNDWFGGKKKREPAKSEPNSKPASPAPGASSSASKSTLPAISKKASTASLPPKANGSKPSSGAKSNRPSTTSTSKAKPVSSKSSLKPPPSLARGTSPKRRRSQSYDSLDEDEYDSEDDLFDDPPPKKRRAEAGDEGSIDISREIWGMFRMNRDKYVSRDVLSDDEDMEVGAMEVEKEEKRSGKLARQEDLEAEEEERRHMEEKKRRKKERDRRGD